MSKTRFEPPEFLGPHGRRLWDLYTEHFTALPALDTVILEQACRMVDLTPGLSDDAKAGKRGSALALGIVTDKIIALSKALGLTYGDRVRLGWEESAKEKARKAAGEAESKKKVGRPRTRLEDMTPEKLGIIVPEGPTIKSR